MYLNKVYSLFKHKMGSVGHCNRTGSGLLVDLPFMLIISQSFIVKIKVRLYTFVLLVLLDLIVSRVFRRD